MSNDTFVVQKCYFPVNVEVLRLTWSTLSAHFPVIAHFGCGTVIALLLAQLSMLTYFLLVVLVS
jgi:hypothetical protein